MTNNIPAHCLFIRPIVDPVLELSGNKFQAGPNEWVPFHEKLWLRSNTSGKSNMFDRESPVSEEQMKGRGSTDEHVALGGSAYCAIWGWRLKTQVSTQSAFRQGVTFVCIGGGGGKWGWGGGVGLFQWDFCKFVIVLLWNCCRKGKEGHNKAFWANRWVCVNND